MQKRCRVTAPAAALCCIAGALAGCGPLATAPPPYPTATSGPPIATPTPTREVGLVVQVTDVPETPKPKRTPIPTPTRFVQPKHAYILLQPDSGPPVSHRVRLIGGNLPNRVPVDVLWSARGRTSAVDTVIYTGPHGDINVSYTVPMSPPGRYVVTAKVNGVNYATARYRVESHATLDVNVAPSAAGDTLTVMGRHFIPRFRLALVAYQSVGTAKPLVLGMVRSSATGMFVFRVTTSHLAPGQYILRSWSVSDLAAQMAETVFEVTI